MPGAIDLLGIDVEYATPSPLIIPVDEPILFNTILNSQSPAISYNPLSGEFTISEQGSYLVNWWAAIDGAATATTLSISLYTDAVEFAHSTSPVVSANVSGTAFISVPAPPITLSLRNTSSDDMFIGDTQVSAGLTIIHI